MNLKIGDMFEIMGFIHTLRHIKKVETKLRYIRINELYRNYGSSLTRKKINLILIEELKQELGLSYGKSEEDKNNVQNREKTD